MAISKLLVIASLLPWISSLVGCSAKNGDLRALDRKIDVARFMGDWYVVASIPIDLPFASEADAFDAVETYRLNEDEEIDITYVFRDGGFDGELTTMRQRGWVHDKELGTEWRVQFLWPFRSAYLIAWLNDEYTRTIVGVPSRRYVWVMSRDPNLDEGELEELSARVEALGYDVTQLRRVPHQTPPS